MEVDVNKIYTYANDGGKLFFGDNVIGKAASFYFEGEQNTYDTVNPLFEGKEDVIYVESWQRRKDGEKRLLAWWCKVLKDKNNKVTGGISTARDITESKLAEEKFQTIFNLSTIGKSLTSPEGKLLKVNQTFAKMLGYSIEELFNINFIDITYNEDINSSKEAIRSLLAKEKSTVRFEKRYIHKNGQLIWTDVSTTLMHDSNGTPLLFITNIVDISDRKNLEANLIHAKEKAEESDKLKSAFLANMSHEIRTPMNGIIGFAGLLKNKQLNPNEKDNYIDIIINSSNRLLSLINDILDISKIETGQVNVVDTKFNLNELLDKLYHFYLPLIQSKNINFLYSPCNQNLIIKTDETKLFQIINNLLNNAVKFTSQGNIELACSLQQDFMEISVSDTGIGIKKEQTENVFNRFQQSEPEIAISYGGTGLGLSIAKAYTELLKGKISLESEYGKGSTFTIHIPIQTFNEENETIVTKSKAFDQSLNNFTVLIAEDEDINFLYLETLLKTTEVKIIRAENGLQAVNVIKENTKINLIIMDIKMPVMNGIEAFKLIQPIRPDIPVIAYTAYAMVGDKEEFLQEGFSYYLSKPTNKKELFETVYGFLQ
jgi:PAS domain S-box-containing protein